VVASGVREQLAKKKKVAINNGYYFIVGADAMGCKIKKRKLTHPSQKHTHPSQKHTHKGISTFFFFFFFKSYLWVIEDNDQMGQQRNTLTPTIIIFIKTLNDLLNKQVAIIFFFDKKLL
jgi:hypothetical protein